MRKKLGFPKVGEAKTPRGVQVRRRGRSFEGAVAGTLGRVGGASAAVLLDPGNFVNFLAGLEPAEAGRVIQTMQLKHPEALEGVAVNLGGTDLWNDWKRTINNKKLTPVEKALGVVVAAPQGALLGMAGRGDHYNAFSDSVTSFSGNPHVLAHELGHAIDFNKRKGLHRSLYALRGLLAGVAGAAVAGPVGMAAAGGLDTLGKEYNASSTALRATPSKDRAASRNILAPAYGSYVGGFAGSIAGAAIPVDLPAFEGWPGSNPSRAQLRAARKGSGRKVVGRMSPDVVRNLRLAKTALPLLGILGGHAAVRTYNALNRDSKEKTAMTSNQLAMPKTAGWFTAAKKTTTEAASQAGARILKSNPELTKKPVANLSNARFQLQEMKRQRAVDAAAAARAYNPNIEKAAMKSNNRIDQALVEIQRKFDALRKEDHGLPWRTDHGRYVERTVSIPEMAKAASSSDACALTALMHTGTLEKGASLAGAGVGALSAEKGRKWEGGAKGLLGGTLGGIALSAPVALAMATRKGKTINIPADTRALVLASLTGQVAGGHLAGRTARKKAKTKKASAAFGLATKFGPGVSLGYSTGREAAGQAAAAVAPRGKRTRAEAIARKASVPLTIGGALAGVYAARGMSSKRIYAKLLKMPKLSKAERDLIVDHALPAAAGMAGGTLTGVATGTAVGGAAHIKKASVTWYEERLNTPSSVLGIEKMAGLSSKLRPFKGAPEVEKILYGSPSGADVLEAVHSLQKKGLNTPDINRILAHRKGREASKLYAQSNSAKPTLLQRLGREVGFPTKADKLRKEAWYARYIGSSARTRGRYAEESKSRRKSDIAHMKVVAGWHKGR
jgi:hypothetical protein